jgi:hypothetical protein
VALWPLVWPRESWCGESWCGDELVWGARANHVEEELIQLMVISIDVDRGPREMHEQACDKSWDDEDLSSRTHSVLARPADIHEPRVVPAGVQVVP